MSIIRSVVFLVLVLLFLCYQSGVTENPNQRTVYAQFVPSDWPEHVQIVAVDPSEKLTDYGATLPKRPYNRVKLSFDTSGFPADTHQIEVAGNEDGSRFDYSVTGGVLTVDFAYLAGV